MFTFIIALILLLLALATITLRKTYYYLPEAELKRQARAGDRLAKTLYRAVAYGVNLRLLLWFLIGLFTAIGLTLFVRLAPFIFGILVVSVILWLGFAWMPSTRLTAYGARLGVWLTPIIVWLLNILNPLFSRLTTWWRRRFPAHIHSGLYERIDLVELIEHQRQQPDNRIAPEVLDLMQRALRFDTYAVHDITVPRRLVTTVKADDSVGPILLDELHASGFSDFPVYETSPEVPTGTLHLVSLDEAKHGGKVSEFADPKLAYLHEADSLADALDVIYKTRQRLFIVVNSFDEYVGITTLEDILHTLLGKPNGPTFETYHDRQAVVAKHAKVSKPKPDIEKTSESDEEVVK
jgi:CBS domain containing-hemolysin-like protein